MVDMKTRVHQASIIELLTPYVAAFPNSRMNEGSLIVYAKALSELSLAEIEAAMLKLMRTCKFFPSVAEIFEQAEIMRSYAKNQEKPTPDEAWHEVMKLVREKHVYSKWEYSCPEVEQTVKHFGRVELCTLESDAVNTARAQFMRIYSSVLNRDKEQKHNDAVMNMLGVEKKEGLIGRITSALSMPKLKEGAS